MRCFMRCRGISCWLNQYWRSLERIQQYMTIEQEPKPTTEGVPPAYWPASGDLRVEKLTARYSAVSTHRLAKYVRY